MTSGRPGTRDLTVPRRTVGNYVGPTTSPPVSRDSGISTTDSPFWTQLLLHPSRPVHCSKSFSPSPRLTYLPPYPSSFPDRQGLSTHDCPREGKYGDGEWEWGSHSRTWSKTVSVGVFCT